MSIHMTHIIVGDVHEQVDALKEIIVKTGFEIRDGRIYAPSNRRLVLVGDYLDKDVRTVEIIEFLYENIDQITMLIGNHERWVYRYFFDTEFKVARTEEYIDKYFTSLKYLEADEAAREKFKVIFERSVPFYETEHFIVTHAPVKKKYLGKSDKKSISHQVNLRRNWENPNEASEFMKAEAHDDDKLHIFGHIALREVERFKNKVGIDTGAYAGNKLTAVEHTPGQELKFHSVSAKGGNFFDKNLQTIFGPG